MQFLIGNSPALLIAIALLLALCGCGTEAPAEITGGHTVAFICNETKEVFAGDMLNSAIQNPKTGRATLVPALYCSRCEKWYPAPPLETLQRRPGASLCPVSGQSMSATGPVPRSPRSDGA